MYNQPIFAEKTEENKQTKILEKFGVFSKCCSSKEGQGRKNGVQPAALAASQWTGQLDVSDKTIVRRFPGTQCALCLQLPTQAKHAEVQQWSLTLLYLPSQSPRTIMFGLLVVSDNSWMVFLAYSVSLSYFSPDTFSWSVFHFWYLFLCLINSTVEFPLLFNLLVEFFRLCFLFDFVPMLLSAA